MAVHKDFPDSRCVILNSAICMFRVDEALRESRMDIEVGNDIMTIVDFNV